MAFFYDSEGEGDVGLPIILEPDVEETSSLPLYRLTLRDPFHDRNGMAASPSPSRSPTSSPATVDSRKGLQVPTHPIPSMQEAFAESMLEVASGATPPQPDNTNQDAAARRKYLLDQDIDEETHAARWKRRPGQQYHELWKLMAQISFGIYLLLNGIAKDEDQVMSILQGHVDEVDEFIEATLEDFDLAQSDINERLKFLKLPLENIGIFDAMLEDRNFRCQIVNGNERIEHVITRTAAAMNDALKDVQQGVDACKEFTIYLAQEQDEALWKKDRADMQKVFIAMKGNVDGWYKAYVSLQTKGNHLAAALVQLGTIVAEMDRRAGQVSRKQRFSMSPPPGSPPSQAARHSRISSSPPPSAGPHSRNPSSPPFSASRHSRGPAAEMRQSMARELPSDPSPITPAIRAALPAFQLVSERERTPEPAELEAELESEPESELEPEPDFLLLKPHTYSPIPSPKPPGTPKPPSPSLQQAPLELPPRKDVPKPEVTKRSSLRQRFSLKRKEQPLEISVKPPQEPQQENYWGPRQQVKTVSKPPPHELEAPVNPPPSRGLDSAYCSDYEKPSPQNVPLPTSSIPTPSSVHFPQPPSSSTPNFHQPPQSTSLPTPTSTHFASPRIPPRAPNRTDPPPSIITRDFVPSPRSDRQFFRPVNASPNSPLQRPWTAAPSNIMHIHSNSSSSNLRYGHTHTPSQLANRNGAPSAMGMSVMSDMTTVTEGGRKVKKKRSAFGWLKKAFSLSEEEKAAFEERRRMADDEYHRGYHQSNQQQKWLDGKRIR
ncbi:hypothetical protein BJ875DRAFT_482251 [Amylocarpus encephaloides]|uniref:Uncharacterized protein n=1 Tax=Amylocarpus encephaloides TaxID=45428 RepID=A0A9P7YMY9_9HELO|nr:hypothetical protein BJ875DRAFT_482251 [Amylocarpus encephaloides]